MAAAHLEKLNDRQREAVEHGIGLPDGKIGGPLLIIDGEVDHTVPWAIANAAFNKQKRNEAVTEIEKIPNRGHSLTIDSGWREVAERALAFVKRFA